MLGKYGRMGNQMFQYATLFSIAKTRGYEFGIPYKTKSDNSYLNLYLDSAFLNLTAKDSSGIKNIHRAQERNFTYNAGIFGIADNTDIIGYFQSEKYFIDYRQDLLKEFEFTAEIKNKADTIRQIGKKLAVSLHIRLGDYLNLPDNHPVCTMEYYQEALNKIPDNAFLFIISDDNEKAAELFKDLKRPFCIPDTKNENIDMCLMTMCDYHIIANSSFSWWGAWLSESKQVIAPSKWFGAEPNMPKNWSDIYCKDWIII
jgi:hypothetical protein